MSLKLPSPVTILLFLVFSILSCGQLKQGKTLKLAHGLNTDHPVHKGIEILAERVAEKSSGKLKIEIYPSQQLGTERQALELLQIGSLAMTKVSAATLENFSPNIKTICLPYIFRDREHAYSFFDSQVGRDLLLQGEKYWLRGLTYFDAGSRSFYTKEKLVESPEDLKGLKIRVMESQVAMNLVKSLGGAPTPISWGELYTALQQGVVDGAENNPPSFYISRHYEVCKYYSLNEHTAVPDILIIGTHTWKNLTLQEQQWLQEAADEASIEQRKIWQAAENKALEEVQKAGVKIIRPDKSTFSQKTQSMLDAYAEDQVMYDLIKKIQSIN